jgi:hypothetical protein
MNLPSELNFLENFYLDPRQHYRTASWLKSDFDSPTWTFNFGEGQDRNIYWNLTLDNGSNLASDSNSVLCSGFKYFIISATRTATGASDDTNALVTQKKSFNFALLVIDLLLLSPHYQISKYGLAGISLSHFKDILARFCRAENSSESVYNWSQTLRNYCLNLFKNTNSQSIDEFLKKHPHALIVTPAQLDDNKLGFDVSDVPRIRAALYLNGDYSQSASHAKCTVNSLNVSKKIFTNTIKGAHYPKTTHHILSFYKNSYEDATEFPAVEITTTENETLSQSHFSSLKMVIYRLGILHDLGLPAPDINALKYVLNAPYPSTKQPGRYRTLPSEVVFTTIRKAIEFHLEHGKEIINGFCKIAIICCRQKISPSKFTSKEIQKIIGPHLVSMGVKYLGLSARSTGSAKYRTSVRPHKKEYFTQLRNNAGLLELLSIYIGSVQLVVGALMARRADELIRLSSENCLDITETMLIFGNAKSTRRLFGIRRGEARPIDPLAVDMIKNLTRMHRILKRIGYTNERLSLFATPTRHGSSKIALCSASSFSKNFDLVCDYFETTVTADGHRYYIRQHQLRRFFALLFFYSNSFGGIETLQWMLGHANLMHIWNYITETLDGATLRGAKAQYVAEKLQSNGAAEFSNLAELFKERYGIDNFTVIDTEELEQYIETLLENAEITIEPEFFVDDRGEQFKIIVKLTRKGYFDA